MAGTGNKDKQMSIDWLLGQEKLVMIAFYCTNKNFTYTRFPKRVNCSQV